MIPISPSDPSTLDQNSPTDVVFESLIDGSRWLRSGFCSRCGNCCDDPENIFAEVDGNGNPGGLIPEVPGKCAYFKYDTDGKAMCTGRDTHYYKNGCQFSPTKIEHVQQWPDCTYTFTKIE